jgi:hypothetical protein
MEMIVWHRNPRRVTQQGRRRGGHMTCDDAQASRPGQRGPQPAPCATAAPRRRCSRDSLERPHLFSYAARFSRKRAIASVCRRGRNLLPVFESDVFVRWRRSHGFARFDVRPKTFPRVTAKSTDFIQAPPYSESGTSRSYAR